MLFQPDANTVCLPVEFIGGDPPERDAGLHGTLQHAQARVRLHGELDITADADRPAALRVRHPYLRDLPLTVDQRRPRSDPYARKTPIWEFSDRTAVPEYWRAAPAGRTPF